MGACIALMLEKCKQKERRHPRCGRDLAAQYLKRQRLPFDSEENIECLGGALPGQGSKGCRNVDEDTLLVSVEASYKKTILLAK